ncbi:CoxG family protein [Natrinema gelatinilyticum]|uniref:CoxG family protein n=1 Tax=Natrinema gelatinilyticum TaxID=2961571 RepID=UPI0020C46ED5|nr:carbon monoxide dehydrogenase subunit G [Natrinema gelatinilyticum]
MQFDGEVGIGTDQQTVWKTISDPEALVLCVPGAEEVERISETHYNGTIKRGIAGVNVELNGEVEMTELTPPDRMVADVTGEDELTGSIMTADAQMGLSENGDGTELAYTMDVEFTGKLATLGSRIMKRKIKSDMNTFFDNLKEHAEE